MPIIVLGMVGRKKIIENGHGGLQVFNIENYSSNMLTSWDNLIFKSLGVPHIHTRVSLTQIFSKSINSE